MNTITVDKKKFIIKFKYDPNLVAAVKTLAKYKWDAEKRQWTVAATLLNKQALLQWNGFAYSQEFKDFGAKELSIAAAREVEMLNRLQQLDLTDLFPYQREGVKFLVKTQKAFLLDEPGCGKSAQALKAAFLLNEPVVIVTKAALKLNWKHEITKWLGKDIAVNIISGTTACPLSTNFNFHVINYNILDSWAAELRKFKHFIFDECQYVKNFKAKRTKAALEMVQDSESVYLLSATPVDNRVKDLISQLQLIDRLDDFGGKFKFQIRYCLPADAPIMMHDLSEKSISDIKVGDKVIGWQRYIAGKNRRLCESEVLDLFVRKSVLQKVILHNGDELVCTPDHLWLNGRSNSKNPDKEFYPARMKYRTKIVKILNAIKPPEYFHTDDYKYGYINGAFRGDGWCTRVTHETYHPFKDKKFFLGDSTYRVGIGCKDVEPINRLKEYLNYFNINYSYSFRDDELHRLSLGNKVGYDFILGTELSEKSKAWWAGFMAGLYDTEGSGQTIAQYKEVNPITYSMIEDGFKFLRFDYKSTSDETFRIRNGRREFLRFWNTCFPSITRKLKSHVFNGGGKFSVGYSTEESNLFKIKEIIPLEGEHDVYTMKTSTGNYVAYGYGSKNCDGYRDNFGWHFDGATNLDELHTKLKAFSLRRKKSDVLAELPPQQYFNVYLNIDNRKEYSEAFTEFTNWYMNSVQDEAKFLASIAHLSPQKQAQAIWSRKQLLDSGSIKAEHLVKLEKLKQLAALGKLNACIEWIETFLESGEKLVVFCIHKIIQKKLIQAFPNAVSILAEDSAETRDRNVQTFQTDPNCKLIICSIDAAGEGITLTAASNTAILEFPWIPSKLSQLEGRTHRIGSNGTSVDYYYLIAEQTVDESLISLLMEKKHAADLVVDGQSIVNDLMTKIYE